MDAANRAVDDNKQQVDKLEAEIKKACEAEPSKCAELSEVLARFPAPAEQTEINQDIAVWTRKLGAWATELAKVQPEDSELRSHVDAFRQKWLALGVAMSRLVAILEVGKKYESLNRDLNTQIERANQAIAEANKACEK
jgi:chromosome segregation ATPase